MDRVEWTVRSFWRSPERGQAGLAEPRSYERMNGNYPNAGYPPAYPNMPAPVSSDDAYSTPAVMIRAFVNMAYSFIVQPFMGFGVCTYMMVGFIVLSIVSLIACIIGSMNVVFGLIAMVLSIVTIVLLATILFALTKWYYHYTKSCANAADIKEFSIAEYMPKAYMAVQCHTDTVPPPPAALLSVEVQHRIVFFLVLIAGMFVMFIITSILGFVSYVAVLAGIIIFLPCACFALPMAVTAPAIGWYGFARLFNPVHRGPTWMIMVAFGWGVVATLVAIINTIIGEWLGQYAGLSAILSAPLFEESFKTIGVLALWYAIRDEYEGALYGLAVGLGFATAETVNYSLSGPISLFMRPLIVFQIHTMGPMLLGSIIGLVRANWVGRIMMNAEESTKKIATVVFGAVCCPIAIVFGMFCHFVSNGSTMLPSLLSLSVFFWDFAVWIVHVTVMLTMIGLSWWRMSHEDVSKPKIQEQGSFVLPPQIGQGQLLA
ncbi:Protease PrsW [Carpediemonas membranifera]|uniref:Protease PrsW n=1 Tax=Carpediemonas membranifera TaxID=201153 RepID=A0A8J6ATE0_9EUKA|nr:Protease PrsW [Carpediemonas membranifera]|eukprot:KAG9393628.1 Protease PrsW [Carpediemonas membranifera]